MNKFTPIVIITLAAGIILGYMWGHYQSAASYAPQIEAVNKALPSATKATSVEGRVKQVNADSLTLEGVAVSMNPFAAGDYPMTRQVTITSSTKIIRVTSKDPQQFQKEMVAYQNSLQNRNQASSTLTPPSPFNETTIQLSDIKVGDSVSATAASDIINAASFEAVQLQVNSLGNGSLAQQ